MSNNLNPAINSQANILLRKNPQQLSKLFEVLKKIDKSNLTNVEKKQCVIIEIAKTTFDIIGNSKIQNEKTRVKRQSEAQSSSWRLPKDWELHVSNIRDIFTNQDEEVKKFNKIAISKSKSKNEESTKKQELSPEAYNLNNALSEVFNKMANDLYENNFGIQVNKIIELYQESPFQKRIEKAGFSYPYTDYERNSPLVYLETKEKFDEVKKWFEKYKDKNFNKSNPVPPEDGVEPRGLPVVAIFSVLGSISTVLGFVVTAIHYFAMSAFSAMRTAPTLYPVAVLTRSKKCVDANKK